mmetsp:Transcript_24004/g.37073  ORF Transcript_24004/g.37073 Transcript_24004/m.37073 type:complete len:400 (-) Transcript_24004:253-1452(-)
MSAHSKMNYRLRSITRNTFFLLICCFYWGAFKCNALQPSIPFSSRDVRLDRRRVLVHSITSSSDKVSPPAASSQTPGIALKAGNNSSVENEEILDEENNIELQAIAPISFSPKQRPPKKLVRNSALAAFSAVLASAKFGILPGLPQVDGSGFEMYTNALMLRDFGSLLLTGTLGYVFVKVVTILAREGILQPRDSRKTIHTLSAPLFMLTWPLFSMAQGARFFAAVVPFINAVRLIVAGSSKSDDDSEKELANAVSRSGNKEEALGGPFIYCIVLFTSILAFWRDSPIGIIALCAMAAGDGMADIVGRRLGKNNKWFFSPSKSVAGSLAFWGFSTIFSIGLVLWFKVTGCMTLSYAVPELATRIALIGAACSAIELQPYGDDNWTVPISAAVLSKLFLT